eukprot:gene6269-6911_t
MVSIVLLYALTCVLLIFADDHHPCDPSFYPKEASLPVLPTQLFPKPFDPRLVGFDSNFSSPLQPGDGEQKLIPRNFWMAFRTKPSCLNDLDEAHQQFIQRARESGWTVYTPGHEEQMRFFEVYYPETSLLWATKLISSSAGASISDIWRVAVVYAFGGFYIDDDAIMGESLETIVQPNDEMIVGRAKSLYPHTCYHKDFHLSKHALHRRFGGAGGGGGGGIDLNTIYGGKTFIQWTFFAKPQHPVLKSILENMVEIIRQDYFQTPAVYLLHTEPRWKMVICATGPDLWTATIAEQYLMNATSTMKNMRVLAKHDFIEYDGYYKLKEAKHYKKRLASHYYNMRDYYLTSHHPACIKNYEGKPITDGSGRVYLVEGGKRRWFPNYDTMTTFNLSFRDPILIYNTSQFEAFPLGENIPPCTNC